MSGKQRAAMSTNFQWFAVVVIVCHVVTFSESRPSGFHQDIFGTKLQLNGQDNGLPESPGVAGGSKVPVRTPPHVIYAERALSVPTKAPVTIIGQIRRIDSRLPATDGPPKQGSVDTKSPADGTSDTPPTGELQQSEEPSKKGASVAGRSFNSMQIPETEKEQKYSAARQQVTSEILQQSPTATGEEEAATDSGLKEQTDKTDANRKPADCSGWSEGENLWSKLTIESLTIVPLLIFTGLGNENSPASVSALIPEIGGKDQQITFKAINLSDNTSLPESVPSKVLTFLRTLPLDNLQELTENQVQKAGRALNDDVTGMVGGRNLQGEGTNQIWKMQPEFYSDQELRPVEHDTSSFSGFQHGAGSDGKQLGLVSGSDPVYRGREIGSQAYGRGQVEVPLTYNPASLGSQTRIADTVGHTPQLFPDQNGLVSDNGQMYYSNFPEGIHQKRGFKEQPYVLGSTGPGNGLTTGFIGTEDAAIRTPFNHMGVPGGSSGDQFQGNMQPALGTFLHQSFNPVHFISYSNGHQDIPSSSHPASDWNFQPYNNQQQTYQSWSDVSRPYYNTPVSQRADLGHSAPISSLNYPVPLPSQNEYSTHMIPPYYNQPNYEIQNQARGNLDFSHQQPSLSTSLTDFRADNSQGLQGRVPIASQTTRPDSSVS